MRVHHDIFHQPHDISLTLEDRPVAASYTTRASGRELGDTMPMWRVQTEGYEDGKGFLVGVVSHAGIDDSPDGEFISGGVNTKGSDSVAIGRQGNFLHWGFAASPTYMTEEAKLVFVNAVHYIARFAGQPPQVSKVGVFTRAWVDDMLFGLSDEGHAAWCALIDEGNAKREVEARKLRERAENGEELSDFQKQISSMPPAAPWTRDRLLSSAVPEEIRTRFGTDWDAYAHYYTENRPYLHPVDSGGYYPMLAPDEDARELGIANDDIELLEKCVAMLEADDRAPLATRLLERYTTEGFKSATAWRAWLDAHRDRLFFTEVGGFKFMVDPRPAVDAPAEGGGTAAKAGD